MPSKAKLADIGINLENIIATVNSSTQGLVMTSYCGIIVSLIIITFNLASNSTSYDESLANHVFNSALVLSTLMYSIRLYFLMKVGEELKKLDFSNKMTPRGLYFMARNKSSAAQRI